MLEIPQCMMECKYAKRTKSNLLYDNSYILECEKYKTNIPKNIYSGKGVCKYYEKYRNN